VARKTWRWTRNASAKHEDAWRERLSFLGPANFVVHARPRSGVVRLEAYPGSARTARQLAEVFGGKAEPVDTAEIAARANAPRRPLRIARILGVIDTHGEWPEKLAQPRILLRISSAMAFGTGEHATTSACLRFLAEEAKGCDPGWNCLDLGTGSGILAIAAEKLGARKVSGLEYDPRAVRAARANARRNNCHRVRITEGDLLKWRPGRTQHRIVLANVFSEILRAAAPQIVRAVNPGGCLILSGILRPQENEVLRTFRSRGMKFEQAARRGKWVTLLLRAR